MKTILGTIAVCFILFTSNAQENTNGVEEKISKFNILYPGFGQELRVSPSTSWGYDIGLNIFFEYSESSNFVNGMTKTKYLELVPTAEIYYRWYYNLLKRQQKKRKTSFNSSEYLFTGARILTPGIKLLTENEEGLNEIISGIYAGWGIRRSIGKKLTLDLSIRYEIQMENFDKFDFSNVYPGFRLGYTIDNKE